MDAALCIRAGQAITHGHSAGYMFNIAMLKKVFNPTFQLHDIRQTAEHELTTRYPLHVAALLCWARDSPWPCSS